VEFQQPIAHVVVDNPGRYSLIEELRDAGRP
jgi:hypothetical protein